MAIPKQVQKQSEEVQELYKELNGETETVQAENAEATEVPAEQPVEQASDSVEGQAPQSEASEQGTSDTQPKETWEQKYKTLQGMYNADVPRLNAQNREMQSRVSQLETLLSTINNQPAEPTPPLQSDPLITDADVKEYGDSIDVMRRAAREEVNAANGRIAQLEKTIQQLQGVVPQVHQVQAQQKQSSEQAFWAGISNAVPNWQEINDNPDFQTWAQANGKVETAHVNDQAKTQLEKQVVPGRGRGGQPVTQGANQTYSPADIEQFFSDVRKGRYKGRESERGRIERDIFAAQREGRIVTAN
jgi:hypothetical protein